MDINDINEGDLVTVAKPVRGLHDDVLLPGERIYVVTKSPANGFLSPNHRLRVRCPASGADTWLNPEDLTPFVEPPVRATIKVGDWFRFDGLEGQAEGLLFMRVEYLIDWGEVSMSRHDQAGVRYPDQQYTRNERKISLPDLLAMIEHGALVRVDGPPGDGA